MLLKQLSENVFAFRQKDCCAKIHDMLIDEDPLGQANFVRLFKVTVLTLHAIMMKPELKLIISAAIRIFIFYLTLNVNSLYKIY